MAAYHSRALTFVATSLLASARRRGTGGASGLQGAGAFARRAFPSDYSEGTKDQRNSNEASRPDADLPRGERMEVGVSEQSEASQRRHKHMLKQVESQLGAERAEAADILGRHGALVKGGSEAAGQLLDALVEWKNGRYSRDYISHSHSEK